jgi:hypothetical protein
MKVGFGFKAHSGWAALVVVGKPNGQPLVVDRRRIELVEQAWAKQPYHAAEDLEPDEARALVKSGIAAAHRIATREMRAAVKRERARGNEVVTCAVLAGEPMPKWSVAEILAVHFRMHKAEGVLFREALGQAANACKLELVGIPEKLLGQNAAAALATPLSKLNLTIAAMGKSAGPPWGKDQKDAALAAWAALEGHSI